MIITPYYGEMLILLLFFICSLRIFFINKLRIDALALFAPLGAIVLVLELINWGLSVTSFALIFITLYGLIINYRSFIRVLNHLYTDSYRLSFSIASSILIVLNIVVAVFLTIYRPTLANPEKYQTTIEKQIFTCSKNGEYKKSTQIFENRNLKLTIYSPNQQKNDKNKNTVILFVPDKRASAQAYQPYLVLLARAGYKIYAGDFGFSTINSKKTIFNFTKRFNLFRESKDNPITFFNSTNPQYLDSYAKEFEILCQIANEYESLEKKFVLLGDGMTGYSFRKIEKIPRKINGTFLLNSIKEYKTPGFGFIEQSDPLFAKIFFNLKKDPTFYIPSYAVMKTRIALEALNDTN